jgi:hypothetical protein
MMTKEAKLRFQRLMAKRLEKMRQAPGSTLKSEAPKSEIRKASVRRPAEPRTQQNRCCSRPLKESVLLDPKNRRLPDDRRAVKKACPLCSVVAGRHIYLPFPNAFSTTEKRETVKNASGGQSYCVFHRRRWVKGRGSPNKTRINSEYPYLRCGEF